MQSNNLSYRNQDTPSSKGRLERILHVIKFFDTPSCDVIHKTWQKLLIWVQQFFFRDSKVDLQTRCHFDRHKRVQNIFFPQKIPNDEFQFKLLRSRPLSPNPFSESDRQLNALKRTFTNIRQILGSLCNPRKLDLLENFQLCQQKWPLCSNTLNEKSKKIDHRAPFQDSYNVDTWIWVPQKRNYATSWLFRCPKPSRTDPKKAKHIFFD